MAKLQTLSLGLFFTLSHPLSTLRWAALCAADNSRRRVAKILGAPAWLELMAPHRIAFEQLLERYHLEAGIPTRLMHTATQSQSVSGFELYILGTLMRCVSAQRVFEIGTYKGRTTYNLAANLADGGRVFTLNYLEPGNQSDYVAGELYVGTPLESLIESLLGNSMVFDFQPWYGSIDLMFIDGNHSLPYVRKDSLNAFRCVRPGGIVAWHDVGPNHPESTVAALEVCEEQGVSPWLIDGTQLLIAVKPVAS